MHTIYITVYALDSHGSVREHESRQPDWQPPAGRAVVRRYERAGYDSMAEILTATFPIADDDRRHLLALKRDDRCRSCGTALKAGAKARWYRGQGTYCASQQRCVEVERFRDQQQRRSAVDAANAYLDGDESALGGGPEVA